MTGADRNQEQFVAFANRPWNLPQAFDLRRKDVVSFVGGGGKTAAMFALASDLANQGWRVVSTSTTHLGRGESSLAPRHLGSDGPPPSPEELLAALDGARHVLVTGPSIEGGERWSGVSPDCVAELSNLASVDVVLVEADGARDLPFKAPAPHEPVVPRITTLLVPVVGVDAVGQTIAAAAHRPEQVAALLELTPTARLTPESIASVLGHPDGGLKARPPGARVRVLVNKVESESDLASAREIARHLLRPEAHRESRPALSADVHGEEEGHISAVVIGAIKSASPVREVRRHMAAIVLAAGRSTRMAANTPKQLLPWNDSTVIGKVVDTLSRCPLSHLLVIIGHHAEDIRREMSSTGAHCVENPDFIEGEMLSSVQVGVRALGQEISGCLVVLADQPWLQEEMVTQLLDAYAAGPAGIVAPSYRGKRGHPVLIDRRYWAELLALPRHLAPRHLLQRHPTDVLLVPVETDSVLRDMDTLEAYRRAREWQGARHRVNPK